MTPAMTPKSIRTLFTQTNALLQGHFQLTSGKHSEYYVQCAQVLQYPDKARLLSQQLAAAYANSQINVVVGPAMGGIHLAHEVAHALGARSLFTERVEGNMALRRNFRIEPGERILVVEDVITTGGSVREVIQLLQTLGGQIVGVGCLVDRTPSDNTLANNPTPASAPANRQPPASNLLIGSANLQPPASYFPNSNLPLAALLRLDIQAYEPENCPLCAQGLPWEKPGSRKNP